MSRFWWMPISYAVYLFGMYVFNAVALYKDVAMLKVYDQWWLLTAIVVMTFLSELLFFVIEIKNR